MIPKFRDRRSRKALGNVHCVTHPIPLSELEEDEVLKTLEEEYYDKDFDSSTHELKVIIVLYLKVLNRK